jgi:hypothetical protein
VPVAYEVALIETVAKISLRKCDQRGYQHRSDCQISHSDPPSARLLFASNPFCSNISLTKRGTAKMPGKGRPFPKGISGNPGGRPKVLGEVQELARQKSPKAINTLSNIMHDEKAPPGESNCCECFAR